jgi:hypothetical protein
MYAAPSGLSANSRGHGTSVEGVELGWGEGELHHGRHLWGFRADRNAGGIKSPGSHMEEERGATLPGVDGGALSPDSLFCPPAGPHPLDD